MQGNTTLDTSAFIEYLMGSDLGDIVEKYFETLKASENAYCSLYSITEIFYVLCRLKGVEYATEKLDLMLSSHIIEVNNTMQMALETGRLKCARAISMADCSCIATAKMTGSRAVFARREKELEKEIKKRSFDVEILLLSELSQEVEHHD